MTYAWDTRSGERLDHFKYHALENQCPLAIDNRSEHLIARGQEGIDVWSLSTGDLRFRIDDGTLSWNPSPRPRSVRPELDDVMVPTTGDEIAIRFADRPVQIWNLRERSLMAELGDETIGAAIYDFRPASRRILIAPNPNSLIVVDLKTGRCISRLSPLSEARWASLSPDGNAVAVDRENKGADLFDAGSGKRIACLVPPSAGVLPRPLPNPLLELLAPGPTFSPSGEVLLTGRGEVHVWTM